MQLRLTPFGCAKTSGDMVGTYVPNSDPWGSYGAQVMTLFESYGGPHYPNMDILMYMEVYEGM